MSNIRPVTGNITRTLFPLNFARQKQTNLVNSMLGCYPLAILKATTEVSFHVPAFKKKIGNPLGLFEVNQAQHLLLNCCNHF